MKLFFFVMRILKIRIARKNVMKHWLHAVILVQSFVIKLMIQMHMQLPVLSNVMRSSFAVIIVVPSVIRALIVLIVKLNAK
jgi:protein-S-isoprenylcysteine O-methyltransferase Ste14